jgi:hypothetical protein
MHVLLAPLHEGLNQSREKIVDYLNSQLLAETADEFRVLKQVGNNNEGERHL